MGYPPFWDEDQKRLYSQIKIAKYDVSVQQGVCGGGGGVGEGVHYLIWALHKGLVEGLPFSLAVVESFAAFHSFLF